jgi:hypothetical protein
MKARRTVALSLLAGFTLGPVAMQPVHAEDTYVRKLPIDALTVPVPIIPPGSSLDLRPTRAPDSSDQMTGYTPLTRAPAPPSIGLSIKSPFEDRK